MPRRHPQQPRLIGFVVDDDDFVAMTEVRRQRIEAAIEIVVFAEGAGATCTVHAGIIHRPDDDQVRTMTFNPLEHPICWSTPDRLAPTTWADCLPFGMFVVDLVRPATLVELGTFTGVSYCGFCQAVKTLGIDTRCFAIDTWEGDPHSGQYGPGVLDDLRRYHDPLYGEFSRLIPATFDKACDEFPDGTIDLLHIDGFHRYEAVKHDVERWLPKMSARGVVLLHDIVVREKDFGVWKVWEELGQQYPCIGLPHGKGLGLLAVGPSVPPPLGRILDASKTERRSIQRFFAALGRPLQQQVDINHRVETLEWQIADRANIIELLTLQVRQKTEDGERLARDQQERLDDALRRLAVAYHEVVERQARLDDSARLLAAARADTAARDSRIEEIIASTSWRLTAPVRFVGRQLRKDRDGK